MEIGYAPKNWVCFPYFFKVSFRGSLLSLPYKNCEKSLSFPRFSHPKITAVSPGPPPPRRRKGVLRISAGRAAAVAGIHPYAEVGEIFLELLYQDRKAEGNGEKARDFLGWKWMEKICKFYEVFISLICDIYIPSFKDEEWCTLMISLTNISWIFHYIPIIPPWFVWENSEIYGKDVWKWL